MRINFRLLLLLIIFSVSGCSLGIENIRDGYKLNPDEGVVVLSLTSSGECGWALFIDIRRIDKTNENTISMQDVMKARDWKRKKSECPSDKGNYSGKLAAIALPPGEYEIYKLTGVSNHHAFVSEDNFSITFDVVQNNITYLGNAHFIVKEFSFNFSTSDMRSRDLSLFKRKHPGISKEYILDILERVTYQGA